MILPSEAKALQAVADHGSAKGAAWHLGISPHTVKTHTKSVREKLGAVTTTQAVALALRQGLIR